MTPAYSARRRADEFEGLLSRDLDAPLSERDAARFAELLDVVADLRALPEVTPRADFSASLRERLMAEADTVLLTQPEVTSRLAMPPSNRKRQRRAATLLGGVALVGATATMAVAAQSSLPGESLYNVKRGIESAQVRLAPDEAARGRLQLAQAETRLGELEALTADDGNDRLIPATLVAFTEQSGDGVRSVLASYAAGGSEQDVQQARDFAATSLDRLDAMKSDVPVSAQEEFLAAGRTLSDLDLEIGFACAACQGGIVSVPGFLLSSAPADLLEGLDVDALTLEGAPISGQDVKGIKVPELLQTPGAIDPSTLPTGQPSGLPTDVPTSLPTNVPTSLPTDPTKTNPPKPDPTDPVGTVTNTVTNTTSNVIDTVDGLTGGALGGLTGGLNDATGGLIGDLTGTLNGATGGLLGNATGGLLP
jgi:hypothetical protein